MKLTKYLSFFILCFGLSFMASAENRYTTEEQLINALPKSITDFWQQGRYASFTGKKNTRINYATFLQDVTRSDKKQNKCLVISTGRTESYLKYKELIYDFYQLGYSVFIHDHRGQGLSARALANPNKGYVEDFQFYVDDLAQFIANVVSPHCSRKPYLLAHSMGGAIAARYLQDYPNTIEAAVLSSPMLGFNSGGLPDFVTEAVIKSMATINQWFSDTPWYFFGHDNFSQDDFSHNTLMHSKARYHLFTQLYKDTPEIQLGGVTTQWLATSLSALETIFTQLDSIKTPTLVMQASEDKIVSNTAQDTFCQQLHQHQPNSCPEGKPLIIAGAYHEIFFEKDIYRQQALNAVIAWFNEHKNSPTL